MATNSLRSSPTPCDVLFVGGAPGPQEEREGRPLASSFRRELKLWASLAELDMRRTAYMNIFDVVCPYGAGTKRLTLSIKEADAAGVRDSRFEIAYRRYLAPAYRSALGAFQDAVDAANPVIIVALGAEALWATSGFYDIRSRRGYLYKSQQGYKAISTYHPSTIVRGGIDLRKLCVADVRKANEESHKPELVFTRRMLTLAPTLADLHAWTERLLSASVIGVDIETTWKPNRDITSIAFAPSPFEAICVPFAYGNASYWETEEDEIAAWRWVRMICESSVPKVFQNGSYDAVWLLRQVNIALSRYEHDTRLAHASLWPELRKDLGTLGSLHANERAWKQLRKGSGDAEKRDD